MQLILQDEQDGVAWQVADPEVVPEPGDIINIDGMDYTVIPTRRINYNTDAYTAQMLHEDHVLLRITRFR